LSQGTKIEFLISKLCGKKQIEEKISHVLEQCQFFKFLFMHNLLFRFCCHTDIKKRLRVFPTSKCLGCNSSVNGLECELIKQEM